LSRIARTSLGKLSIKILNDDPKPLPINPLKQQINMRYRGTITNWKDEKGFGFITPSNGGNQLFVHITSFANRKRRPLETKT
jgi:hypothetical protein